MVASNAPWKICEKLPDVIIGEICREDDWWWNILIRFIYLFCLKKHWSATSLYAIKYHFPFFIWWHFADLVEDQYEAMRADERIVRKKQKIMLVKSISADFSNPWPGIH